MVVHVSKQERIATKLLCRMHRENNEFKKDLFNCAILRFCMRILKVDVAELVRKACYCDSNPGTVIVYD